jgi:hypothetical protein
MAGQDRNGAVGSGNKRCRIAVVGDVHDMWSEEDVIALNTLNLDVCIFVVRGADVWQDC